MSQTTNLWHNYDSANSCLSQVHIFIRLLEQKDLHEKVPFVDKKTYTRIIEDNAFHRLSQMEDIAMAVGTATADLEYLYNRF